MAESMNCCVFSGNLTSDARSKDVNGTEVARPSAAVNGRKDDVTFIQCSHWNPKGVLPYLTKGKQVCVSGSIHLAQWEKDGEPKSAIELNVRSLTLMGGAEKKQQQETDCPF